MKTIALFTTKISKNLRTVMFIAILVLFVLAAGAPSATGTIGG